MLEDSCMKGSQGQGWKIGVKWTDEIFIEPMCFFDLEAYAGDLGQVFCGEIDDEADTKVIQPCDSFVSLNSYCVR